MNNQTDSQIRELSRKKEDIIMEKGLSLIDIVECGEQLYDISDFIAAKISMTKVRKEYQGEDKLYARESVCIKLKNAEKRLPEGYSFVIFDAHRHVEYQQMRFEQLYNKIRKENPSLSDDEVRDRTFIYVFPPSWDLKTPPPHSTGGAIDLSVLDANGIELDMGTKYGEFNEKTYTNNDEIRGLPRANRIFLTKLLISQGFTNYPGEWWHFMYGDREWAAYTGQKNAIYTRVDIEDVMKKTI